MAYQPRNTKVLVSGISLTDTTNYLDSATKRAQARILSELEKVISDKETFQYIRKCVLDATNDLSRDVVNNLFGEIID